MAKTITVEGHIEQSNELLDLSVTALRFCNQCECTCCGSRDIWHDQEACKQAAYIGFDVWRSGLMATGQWDYLEDGEYLDQMPEEAGIAPDGVCPAMGLY